MKRWIHAVTEPSSLELGNAISQGQKRINDRFEPFKVSNTYFNRYATNSTGYRITLDDSEWILDNDGNDSWSSNFSYKLYGPFLPGEIKEWSKLFTNTPIGEYKNLDSAMNYLFQVVDVDEGIEGATDIEAEEDDEWEFKPFSKGTYCVSTGYGDVRYTNNPKTAISYWFRFQRKNPTDVDITCQKKDQAVALCKAATPELLTELYDKYGCPYKLDWLISEAQKKVDDGQKYFYEGEYGYGDTIHPFGVG